MFDASQLLQMQIRVQQNCGFGNTQLAFCAQRILQTKE
jgi:hypothetical protein